MRIKAFAALRPTREMVQRVAAVPYDTVTRDEARWLVDGNDWNFLHVSRPDIDLPDDADPHGDAAYAKAAENCQRLRDEGVLVQDPRPSLFVYRQTMGKHTQCGVFACCHVDDYRRGVILQHEKTRADKEDDRARHIMALRAHPGPVFLTYRDIPEIDAIVATTTAKAPMFDFRAADGVGHTVWRVPDAAGLDAAFAGVPVSYIADGHHRAAAAVRTAEQMKAQDPSAGEDAEYNWFAAVLFPASQLRILPYNRCVRDLNGQTPEAFLAAVRERFTVTESSEPAPTAPRQVSMYLGGQWYGLGWEGQAGSDPVAALDVSVLQDRLLGPVLGIDDPRRSERITFVGGIRGTAELVRQVGKGGMAVAFSMYPVTVEQMMAIADAHASMPPKSTWFEPKLRSGLLIHTF